jgi:ATP-dependent Clp protease ATP-binding subunit ClpA
MVESGDDTNLQERVRDELRRNFRPEFLNRIDDIITFNALTRDLVARITDIQLDRLCERLAAQDLHVEVTDAAKFVLSEEGFDPSYGARPLKRTIQREVENPLALEVLEGRFGPGSRILIDAQDGELVFVDRSSGTTENTEETQ